MTADKKGRKRAPLTQQEIHAENVAEALAWGDDPSDRPYHTPARCAGHACPFHNPSDHPLAEAKRLIRFDKEALVERICEHGVGHSDPDSVAYLVSLDAKNEYLAVHGCDGCCGKRA